MSVQMCVHVHETISDANMKKKEVEDPKNIVKLSCNKTLQKGLPLGIYIYIYMHVSKK